MKNLVCICLIINLFGCKNNISAPENRVESIDPVIACDLEDSTAPVLTGTVLVKDEGVVNSTPTFSFNEGIDNCYLSYYLVSIGTSVGADDIVKDLNIGKSTESFISNLKLDYKKNYFLSVRAVDSFGNTSGSITSEAFQIFSPSSLGELVLWLDSFELESIFDENNNSSSDFNFSGKVSLWNDISNSTHSHDFTKTRGGSPQYDSISKGLMFNGGQELMETLDHQDINLGTYNARNISIVFKPGEDISRRQILFEEGGSVRGVNIFIENGDLHCGFWNLSNDGDGKQDFIESSVSINQDTLYIASLNFDFSHYQSSNGAPGTVQCIVNKVEGQVQETKSRLYAHSGDIGIAGMNNDSYFSDGAGKGEGYYYNGLIFELLLLNTALNNQQINKLQEILLKKWQ